MSPDRTLWFRKSRSYGLFLNRKSQDIVSPALGKRIVEQKSFLSVRRARASVTEEHFDMTISSRESYLLGGTSHEHERLIRQARIFPFTERLFRNAGVAHGQRVLDIGSGVGDVAMLVAELVGPTGEVVGVERDANTLTKARSRVAEAQLRNVSFVATDVSQVVNEVNN
jgi:protein-L-isoaspartate O-methyltransferase